MPWPPVGLPVPQNWTDATPAATVHANAHNVIGAALDDLVAQTTGLGKYVVSGYGGNPTWIDPAAEDWADVIANEFGWIQFAFQLGGDTVDVLIGRGDLTSYINFFIDGTGGIVLNANGTDLGAIGFINTATSAVVQSFASPTQTEPLLDLRNAANATIFGVAPDGAVGGVTPTTTAFVIEWDGAKWIAASLAAVYEAFGTAILKTVVNAKGDLISATADNTPSIVTAGADDTILMADSAQASGLKWVASATPSTQAIGDAASTGTADTFTRGDHKHAMPAFATNAVTLGSSAAAGAATTLMRSNDTIAAFDATAPTTSAIADTAAVGVAAFAARRDHVHGREDLDQSNCAPSAAETIAANYSAVVVGPYVVGSGVLVTISSGGVLAIL